MPIVTTGEAEIGLYAIRTSKAIPQVIYHWKIDCTNLRDPQGQKQLRSFDGRDSQVQAFLLGDPRLKPILHACKMIAGDKQKWTSIAFFDHHGKWISAGMVELVAKELDAAGYKVAIYHTWKEEGK